MTTPLSARVNLDIVDGQKYQQSFGLTNSGGAPILIDSNSGIGAITDSEGTEILALPSVSDANTTGIISTETGIFTLNIIKTDVLSLPVNRTYNFDISVMLTEYPDISPHKPIRGNLRKLEGSYLS